MRHQTEGLGDTMKYVTGLLRRISLEWGFTMNIYHDKYMKEIICGINLEQYYLLICDQYIMNIRNVSYVINKPTLICLNRLISDQPTCAIF